MIKRQREEGALPKEPMVDLVPVDDTETRSDKITKYVTKHRT